MSVFGFDEPVDRREVPALKTHRVVIGDKQPTLFAAGVADMDFRAAPAILAALQQRLEHGVFGYEAVPDGLLRTLSAWLSARHGWDVPLEQILRAPNALNSLAISVSLFSAPGDGIIVQPPVFFDFYDVIQENGRAVARNPLLLRDGRYVMDFEGLESLARDPANRMLLLCNPHNPVGRVWTRGELIRLSKICKDSGVLVIADELHGDIVYPGHIYHPFASLGLEAANNSITILSPAKTFNIASCCSAFTILSNSTQRDVFRRENSRLTVNKNNAFANAAMEAAYRAGGPWLDAVITYLHKNLAVLRERIAHLPRVNLVEPEGTFLAWLDFRGLGLEPDALDEFLRNRAGWALTRGDSFGTQGSGYMRLNFACCRDRLCLALDDLAEALDRS